MGQGGSKGPLSPLECLIENFTDFQERARRYGATVNVYDLRKFCEFEWPTFGVGWPDVGTLDVGPAGAVRAVCYGSPGHPDQIPYIDTWIDILVDKPSYLKDCGRPRRRERKGNGPRFFWLNRPQKAPEDPRYSQRPRKVQGRDVDGEHRPRTVCRRGPSGREPLRPRDPSRTPRSRVHTTPRVGLSSECLGRLRRLDCIP